MPQGLPPPTVCVRDPCPLASGSDIWMDSLQPAAWSWGCGRRIGLAMEPRFRACHAAQGRTDKNQTASRVDKAANRCASKTCDRSRGRRLCHRSRTNGGPSENVHCRLIASHACMYLARRWLAAAGNAHCACVCGARALLSWCRQQASLHA